MYRWAAAPQLSQHEEVKAFNLVARPWGFAQKFQAGRNTGINHKAANMYALAQIFPAIVLCQRSHHGFKLDAMQRVTSLFG